jgi:hypothetical protein
VIDTVTVVSRFSIARAHRLRALMPSAGSTDSPAEVADPSGVTGDDVAWLYREILDREASPAEIAHQTDHAAGLRELLAGVLGSAEHQTRRSTYRELVAADVTRRFSENLRLLNDTLADTLLANRYWVWGGLLIGWAREGAPLAHDSRDADFCIRTEDVPHLHSAVPALADAGFAPALRFLTNDGRPVEYSFVRDGAKFEFFVLEPVDGRLRYYDFSDGARGDGPPTQATAEIAEQRLERFELVGRTWLKHADHEAELTAMYGDWRTPDPAWEYMNDVAIVERTAWERAGELPWNGDVHETDPPCRP